MKKVATFAIAAALAALSFSGSVQAQDHWPGSGRWSASLLFVHPEHDHVFEDHEHWNIRLCGFPHVDWREQFDHPQRGVPLSDAYTVLMVTELETIEAGNVVCKTLLYAYVESDLLPLNEVADEQKVSSASPPTEIGTRILPAELVRTEQ